MKTTNPKKMNVVAGVKAADTKDKKKKSVTFSKSPPEVYEMNPAMFIRNKKQDHPQELNEQVYDRRINNARQDYETKRKKVLFNLYKTSPELYKKYYEAKHRKRLMERQERKNILHSKEMHKLWNITPKKRHHYDISPDSSDSE